MSESLGAEMEAVVSVVAWAIIGGGYQRKREMNKVGAESSERVDFGIASTGSKLYLIMRTEVKPPTWARRMLVSAIGPTVALQSKSQSKFNAICELGAYLL